MIPPRISFAAAFTDDALDGILLARTELNVTEVEIVFEAGRGHGCLWRSRFCLR